MCRNWQAAPSLCAGSVPPGSRSAGRRSTTTDQRSCIKRTLLFGNVWLWQNSASSVVSIKRRPRWGSPASQESRAVGSWEETGFLGAIRDVFPALEPFTKPFFSSRIHKYVVSVWPNSFSSPRLGIKPHRAAPSASPHKISRGCLLRGNLKKFPVLCERQRWVEHRRTNVL